MKTQDTLLKHLKKQTKLTIELKEAFHRIEKEMHPKMLRLENIAKLSEEYLYWLNKVANGNVCITEMNSLHLCEHSLKQALQELRNPYAKFEKETPKNQTMSEMPLEEIDRPLSDTERI